MKTSCFAKNLSQYLLYPGTGGWALFACLAQNRGILAILYLLVGSDLFFFQPVTSSPSLFHDFSLLPLIYLEPASILSKPCLPIHVICILYLKLLCSATVPGWEHSMHLHPVRVSTHRTKDIGHFPESIAHKLCRELLYVHTPILMKMGCICWSFSKECMVKKH